MPKRFDIDQPESLHTLLEILYPFDKSKSRCVLSDGTVLSKSEDSENYNMFDYYNDFCLGTKFENISVPHIFLHACFSMPWLENIRYDADIVDYLNQQGLWIYLMEPLFLYTGDRKKFYRDLLVTPPGGIDFRDLETCFATEIGNFRSFELDSIEEFVTANNLKNVVIHLETAEGKSILEEIYPFFSIETTPLLPITYRNILEDYSRYEHSSDKIEKKFICPNWRYEPHRHIMASFLADLDCYLSWKEDSAVIKLQEKIWFDLSRFPYYERIQQGCELLEKNPRGPLEGDGMDTDSCPTGKKLPVEIFSRAFCNIITEPYFAYPFSVFSEKVIHSMILEKPFILVAPARTIKYLKSLGFQTFDRWWSEDYDNISDHTKRLESILKLIDGINFLPIEEIRSIYREMESVLKYNKHHIDLIKQ